MIATTRPRGRPSLLRVHALLIVATVAVTLASAWAAVESRQAGYVATAQVSVGPEQAGGTALRPEMASERTIVSSGSVATLAAATLGEDTDAARRGLAVSIVIESSILNIRYSARTDAAAEAGARAFAQGYVDYRNDVAGTRLARVVTWPDTAARTGTHPSLVLGVALLAGLVLGLGAAWSWDRLSDRVRSPEELTDRSGLPVLAEVGRWRWRGQLAPPGPGKEAFSYLSTRLASLLAHRHAEVTITVTSPRAGAGTTTVALNTARAIAAQGRTVVLVGADLHHPQVHECLGAPAAPGLLDVLAGECALDSAVRPTRWQNLSVLPVGVCGPDDETSLQPDVLDLVLEELGASAIVVVDAPPVLADAVALMLVDKSDALLLVGDLRAGRRRDVEHAARLMEEARPAVAGWVANLPRRGPDPGLDEAAHETASAAEAPGTTATRSDRVAS